MIMVMVRAFMLIMMIMMMIMVMVLIMIIICWQYEYYSFHSFPSYAISSSFGSFFLCYSQFFSSPGVICTSSECPTTSTTCWDSACSKNTKTSASWRKKSPLYPKSKSGFPRDPKRTYKTSDGTARIQLCISLFSGVLCVLYSFFHSTADHYINTLLFL